MNSATSASFPSDLPAMDASSVTKELAFLSTDVAYFNLKVRPCARSRGMHECHLQRALDAMLYECWNRTSGTNRKRSIIFLTKVSQ